MENAGAGTTITARLLGVPVVTRDGEVMSLPRSCAALLASLLLSRGRSVARPELVEVIGGDGGDGGRHRLNTSLWRLRRALEPDGRPRPTIVVADRSGIAINRQCTVWVDVEELERACRTHGAEPVDRWTEQNARAVAAALEAHPGELLSGCDDEWLLGRRAQLGNLQLDMLTRLVQWHSARGDVDGAVRFGEQVLAREPLREDVHRALISAYAFAGHRDAAVRQFERCRAVLAAELGIDPMPETVAAATRAASPVPGPRRRRPPVLEAREVIGELEAARAIVRDLEATRTELARLAQLVDRSLQRLHALRG